MENLGTYLTLVMLASGCAGEGKPTTQPKLPDAYTPSVSLGLDSTIMETCRKHGDTVTDGIQRTVAIHGDSTDRAASGAGIGATSGCLRAGDKCEGKGEEVRSAVLAGTSDVNSQVEAAALRAGVKAAVDCMAADGYKIELPVKQPDAGDSGHPTAVN